MDDFYGIGDAVPAFVGPDESVPIEELPELTRAGVVAMLDHFRYLKRKWPAEFEIVATFVASRINASAMGRDITEP